MGKHSGKQSLFGDDDGAPPPAASGGRGGGADARAAAAAGNRGLLNDGDADDAAVLGFNPEYARRFEHNKQREALHRLKERNPRLAARLEREAAREVSGAAAAPGDDDDDSDETSSSSDDDDDDLEELARKDDTDRVLDVLAKLKKKDPAIHKPEVKFFDDDDDEEEDDGGEEKKAAKPVFLRQVLAEQALASQNDEDEDGEAGARQAKTAAASRIPVYDAEQQAAKKAFLTAAAAAEGENDDGGGLVVRRGRKQQAAAADGDKDARVQKLLSDYFGDDDNELDPDERFLKQYLGGRKWLQASDDDDDDGDDGDDDPQRADNDNPQDDPEDDDFEERAEEYEAAYNHRFEQAGSGQIVGHPRQIPDAIRKKDDKRARQRQLKAERKAAEKREAEEELKRLKNAKMSEIQDRLAAVQEVAGVAGPDKHLVDALLEGDFDPDEYDRRMAAAFGEEYYDKEQDGDAVEDKRAAELLRKAGAIDADEEEVPLPIGIAAKSTKKSIDESAAAAADARAEVSRLMEEYYALDYEGTAGGLKTRFRYRSVEPSTGGLSLEEILAADDKTLNSIVSLKLLAPYREPTKIRPNYKALQALRESRQQQQGGKRRRQPAGGRGPSVRLEREGGGGGEGGEKKPWHDKWKKTDQPQDKQSARAASFAPLSLSAGEKRKGGAGDAGPVTKKGKVAEAAPAAGPSLSRAQKKNLKRAQKRAAEREAKA